MKLTRRVWRSAILIAAAGSLSAVSYFTSWYSASPAERLGRQVAQSMDVLALQAWAEGFLENQGADGRIAVDMLPAEIRRLAAPMLPWQGWVHRSSSHVQFVSPGSFGGYGITVGPRRYQVETNSLTFKIAEGVYAHRYP